MTDLLLAVLATAALTTVGLLALCGLTFVPVVLSLRLAAAKRLSPGRVGSMAAGGILLGLALAGGALLTGVPVALVLPALALVYAVPVLLRVLARPALAGAAGQHE